MSSILSTDTRQIHRTLVAARNAEEKYVEDPEMMTKFLATSKGKRAGLAHRIRYAASVAYFSGMFLVMLGVLGGLLHLTGLAWGLRGEELMATIPAIMQHPILALGGGLAATALGVFIYRNEAVYHHAAGTPQRDRRNLKAAVKKATTELLDSVKSDLVRTGYTVSAVYPENFTFVTQHGMITFLEDNGEPTLALNGGVMPNTYADMIRPTMQTMGGQDVKVDEHSK